MLLFLCIERSTMDMPGEIEGILKNGFDSLV